MTIEPEVRVHHGVEDCIPTPKSITVTMPWEDFVKVFALVAKSSPARCRDALEAIQSPVGSVYPLKRPVSAYTVADYDLGKLFSVLAPFFRGDEN